MTRGGRPNLTKPFKQGLNSRVQYSGFKFARKFGLRFGRMAILSERFKFESPTRLKFTLNRRFCHPPRKIYAPDFKNTAGRAVLGKFMS